MLTAQFIYLFLVEKVVSLLVGRVAHRTATDGGHLAHHQGQQEEENEVEIIHFQFLRHDRFVVAAGGSVRSSMVANPDPGVYIVVAILNFLL